MIVAQSHMGLVSARKEWFMALVILCMKCWLLDGTSLYGWLHRGRVVPGVPRVGAIEEDWLDACSDECSSGEQMAR